MGTTTKFVDKPIPTNLSPGESMVNDNGTWTKLSREETEKKWIVGEVEQCVSKDYLKASGVDFLVTTGGIVGGFVAAIFAPVGALAAAGILLVGGASGWVAGDIAQNYLNPKEDEKESIKAACINDVAAKLREKRTAENQLTDDVYQKLNEKNKF